jgi:replicative DNA helicase
MSGVELTERIFAAHADVDLHRVRTATLSTDELRRVGTVSNELEGFGIRVVESATL